jgi:hypothetical protein
MDDTSSIGSGSTLSLSSPSHQSRPLHHHSPSTSQVQQLKDNVLCALACAGGAVDSPDFEHALLPLCKVYHDSGWDARINNRLEFPNYNPMEPNANRHSPKLEGMWLTLTKPTYFGNLGETSQGDPMYTLGRMAFDMFLPTQLVCSLQGNFNPVRRVVDPLERAELLQHCPKSLLEEIQDDCSVLRTYE